MAAEASSFVQFFNFTAAAQTMTRVKAETKRTRVHVSGAFTGSLHVEYKWQDQADTAYKKMADITAPTDTDLLLDIPAQTVVRVRAATLTLGTPSVELS